MLSSKRFVLFIFILTFQSISSLIYADDDAGTWSGNIAVQGRWFWESPQFDDQRDGDVSLSFEPEYYKEWANGLRAITFVPFARIDSTDPERTHADIHEAHYLHVAGDWEWRVGVAEVFWGVTESQHLVDIINQTDLVESIDTEDKLGQPMIETTWLQDWGAFQFYVLPGFRERTFPGRKGRLRTGIVVDTDEAEYESGAEEYRVDWSVRLKMQYGPIDVGFSHFSGTSRDPVLRPGLEPSGKLRFIPFYKVVDRTGIDLQAIVGNWTWKLESVYQNNRGQNFTAAVGGFEYTFYGVMKSVADVGVLAEYNYDDRPENELGLFQEDAAGVFQDDMFLGLRYVLNDAQSTEVLAGTIYDLDYNSQSFRVELERRISDSWRVEGELQLFESVDEEDPLNSFERDDHLQVDLAYYF